MKKPSTTLLRIQKTFPGVTRIVESKSPVLITVLEKDINKATKKDPNNCALAEACKRSLSVDGAIIGLTYSWLIKGAKAIRFKTSESVAREITSFDRHHDFAEGKNYRLGPISPSSRLDRPIPPRVKTRTITGKKLNQRHHTANVRAAW